MSTGVIIISIVVFVLGVAWLAWPLVQRSSARLQADSARQRERDLLLTHYERVLTILRDLDEDHALGKLASEPYAIERERWGAEGAALLEALERTGGQKPVKAPAAAAAPAEPQSDADAALDDAIEQAIASYIQAQQRTSSQGSSS
jgi:hypothetical protein